MKIPDKIKNAVHNALASYPVAANTGHAADIACEAFAKALCENPIAPTDEQINEFYAGECEAGVSFAFLQRFAQWFQRHMFSEMEVPESPEKIVKDVFDAFAAEFFATRGRPSQEAMDSLHKAMTIQAGKESNVKPQ